MECVYARVVDVFQLIVDFRIIVKKKAQKEEQRNHQGAMAKPASEQQFRKSDMITFCFVSFLEQYTKRNRVLRQAGWPPTKYVIYRTQYKSKFSTFHLF